MPVGMISDEVAQFPDGAIFDEVQRCPELFMCKRMLSEMFNKSCRFKSLGNIGW